MLFGAWKKKAEAIPFSVHLGSTQKLIAKLTKAFTKIKKREVIKMIVHVEDKVWPKVCRLEDI